MVVGSKVWIGVEIVVEVVIAVGMGVGGDGGCQECAELPHEEKSSSWSTCLKHTHLSKTQRPV